MGTIEEEIQEILHEWHTPNAERILREMGVSERNWRLFAMHSGTADGHTWSFRELEAELDYGITHVRVHQIVKKTGKRLQQYVAKKKIGP